MKQSGIYRIDGPNDKVYIGSAINIQQRWAKHKWHLRKHHHSNPKLQAAYDKYGEDAFRFSIVEVVVIKEK